MEPMTDEEDYWSVGYNLSAHEKTMALREAVSKCRGLDRRLRRIERVMGMRERE